MAQIQMARGGKANRVEAAAIRVGPNEGGKKNWARIPGVYRSYITKSGVYLGKKIWGLCIQELPDSV